jgi:hypothetical protein
MKNLSKILQVLILVIIVLTLTSCAQQPDCVQCLSHPTYGFFGGIWHGLVAPFGLVGQMLNPENIAMYAKNNTGGWYDFGFLLGIGVLFMGGTLASKFEV